VIIVVTIQPCWCCLRVDSTTLFLPRELHGFFVINITPNTLCTGHL